MKAIEIKSKTDKSGHLKLDYKLADKEKKVRILILFDEEAGETEEEERWLYAMSKNPSFSFLNDPAEDIYKPNDGEPLND